MKQNFSYGAEKMKMAFNIKEPHGCQEAQAEHTYVRNKMSNLLSV